MAAMNDKNPSDRRFAALGRRFACGLLAGLLALAGCAPGSGGTGTGPSGLTYSGVGSAVVFVATTTGTGTGGGTPASGPGVVQDASCSMANAILTLDLQASRIELDTPCSQFVHEGSWQPDGDGKLAVLGTYATPSLGRTELVTLRLQFGPGHVVLTLEDAFGRVVVGPATLNAN